MISPKFDCYANMIKVLRDKNIAWELIDYLALEANESDDEHLKTKLGYFSDLEGLPKITCQEWHNLVEDRKGAEESGVAVDDGGLFVDYEPNNEAVISEKTVGPQNCW